MWKQKINRMILMFFVCPFSCLTLKKHLSLLKVTKSIYYSLHYVIVQTYNGFNEVMNRTCKTTCSFQK